MAIFKNRDRANRRAWKAYHAAALASAKGYAAFAEPGDPLPWDIYRDRMQEMGVLPVTQAKFQKDMRKR